MTATKTKTKTKKSELAKLSDEQLTTTAKKHLEEFSGFATKSVVALWEAGKVLAEIRTRTTKTKTWGKWLKDNGVAEPTASQAIRLADHFRTADQVGKYDTITEAKIAAGIVQGRINKQPEKTERPETGWGDIDYSECRMFLRYLDSLGMATTKLEQSVEEATPEEKPVLLKVIDAEIERLNALKSKLGGANAS